MEDSVDGDRTCRRIAVASLILVCLSGGVAVLGFNRGHKGANFLTKSWDSYINNLIAHSGGACDKVAIIGLLDGSSWTTRGAPNAMSVVGDEGRTLANAFKDQLVGSLEAKGILIEGTKYQFIQAADNVMLGKKKGAGSVTLQKSKKAIVIGHTPEGQQQGNTNIAVSKIAEYLESLGV